MNKLELTGLIIAVAVMNLIAGVVIGLNIASI